MDFTAFVLSQLPPPPARVLEIGCGEEGGVVAALAASGYDALGVDPRAPAGPRFRSVSVEQLEEGEPTFDAVVAGRVLHHLRPLGDMLDRLARLAPVLVVDEFSREALDVPAMDWYEGQYRLLVAAGIQPPGPPSLREWRERHPDLHPSALLLDELRARYDERTIEWVPYLHRWLEGPSSAALETALVETGAIAPIGWRWCGVRK